MLLQAAAGVGYYVINTASSNCSMLLQAAAGVGVKKLSVSSIRCHGIGANGIGSDGALVCHRN